MHRIPFTNQSESSNNMEYYEETTTSTRGINPTSPAGNARRRRIGGISDPQGGLTMLSDGSDSNKDVLKQKRRGRGGGTNDTSFGSFVPLWLVSLVCGVFVMIGFAQNQYKKGTLPSSVQKRLSQHVKAGTNERNVKPKRKRFIVDREAKNAVPKASLLSPEEDDELEYDQGNDNVRYHVVFSTDCSPYQHWQAYLVYFSSMQIKQPGHVTRIVSGCTEDEAIAMEQWFHDDISYMSKRFHIQLTPKFSEIKNDNGDVIGDYKFFNKPFGLKYWLENTPLLKYDNVTNTFPSNVQNDVVILIDPDMGLIRPITSDFSNPTLTIISPLRQKNYNASYHAKVQAGHPFAQTYGFGTQWQRLDLKKVTGDDDTPSATVSQLDGRLYYPVGPPYLGTVSDMHPIAIHWSKFVPGVYEQYPHLLAEMFAYCIAAAHLNLPHTLIDSLMVSDVDVSNGEGWGFIDTIPDTDDNSICEYAYNNPDTALHPLPNVFHMCQRYTVGKDWFFAKRKMPSDIYDCDVPLFSKPPNNLARAYKYKHPPGGTRSDLSPVSAKRSAFAICFLYGLVNAAATYYKQNSCPPTIVKPNYSMTRNLAAYAHGKQN